MYEICGDVEYVSCAVVTDYFNGDTESYLSVFPVFLYSGFVLSLIGNISLPLLICKYLTTCKWWGIIGLIEAGGFCGALAAIIVSLLLFPYSIYIVRNILYATDWCVRSLHDTADYAVTKLTNCCSRLARLIGFSGSEDEQETDVESSSAEELSEITTSSS
jgi:hypothetical protein